MTTDSSPSSTAASGSAAAGGHGAPSGGGGAASGGEHTVKRRRKKATNIKVSALNITSFMDLTFNLLMFFVLTASFSSPEGVLPASLPRGGGSGPSINIPVDSGPPPTQVVIVLRYLGNDQQPQIQIEGAPDAPADFEDLYRKLNGWRLDPQTNPQGTYKDTDEIVIKPDRAVKWNSVVEAFNAVIRARYRSVGFAPAEN